MKAVVQRVASASVSVDNKIISDIGKGLLVLVGVGATDQIEDGDKLVKKLVSIRLFDGEDGRWKKNIQDVNGNIMCISQFTLHANTKRGAKPDFHGSAKGECARELYDGVVAKLRSILGPLRVADGEFGAMMQVSSINDGPVTILLDTAGSQTPKESDKK